MRAIIVILVIALTPVFSIANTIHVDVSGGGDYDNLQEAYGAAVAEDTILVAPGTYSGDANRGLLLDAKSVAFISESGPEMTIIDCENMGTAFYLSDFDDTTTVIKGFTITRAYRNRGGAIPCYWSSPLIEDCVFVDNASGLGGAVYIRYQEAKPEFRDCVFLDNSATSNGGAIYLSDGASLTLTNCVFAGNEALENGDALYLSTANYATVTYCTFYGNGIPTTASAIYNSESPTSYTNCIISFGDDSSPMYCPGIVLPTTTHCVVYGHTLGDTLQGNYHDNMFVDPLFCDVFADNFELCSNSPCLPGNNSWGEQVGAYGLGCGECDAPAENTPWGGIKSLLR